MNKHILMLGLCAFLTLSIDAFSEQYHPLTQQEEANFVKQVNKAIQNAENLVQELQSSVTRRDISPMWNNKLELQNAIIQLEVKKTLVNNFRGTESLESPLVRETLLAVLNKSVITTADLADLQTTVLEEKAKIRAQKSKAPAQEAAKPEPVKASN